MSEATALYEAHRRGRACADRSETPAPSLHDLMPWCRLGALIDAFERGRVLRRTGAQGRPH
jgi:hypothetical protein